MANRYILINQKSIAIKTGLGIRAQNPYVFSILSASGVNND